MTLTKQTHKAGSSAECAHRGAVGNLLTELMEGREPRITLMTKIYLKLPLLKRN